MKLFGKPIDGLFGTILKKTIDTYKELSEYDIETDKPQNLATKVCAKHKINFQTNIDFENVETKVEKQEHLKTVFVYYSFSIKNKADLLQYTPDKQELIRVFQDNIVDANINGNILTIPINTGYANINLTPEIEEKVKKSILNKIDKIKKNIEILKSECDEFDEHIYNKVLNSIEKEKIEMGKKKLLENRLNPFK